MVGEVEARSNPEENNGWTVLATTVRSEECPDADILQAYQDQNTTVEPGFRWIKNPAAMSPVWLEKPERIAALVMLTVIGLLVYTVIQRQVRLSLRTHGQQIPGNKGLAATPTAAVVLALFAQVALIQLGVADQQVKQMYGVQPHHLLLCAALGLDSSWYEVCPQHKKTVGAFRPLERRLKYSAAAESLCGLLIKGRLWARFVPSLRMPAPWVAATVASRRPFRVFRL